MKQRVELEGNFVQTSPVLAIHAQSEPPASAFESVGVVDAAQKQLAGSDLAQ
jgi:hypothetical protein